VAKAREIAQAFPGLLRWDDVARIDERDLALWYKEALVENLTRRRERLIEQQMVLYDANGQGEPLRGHIERLDFAIDHANGVVPEAVDQRAAFREIGDMLK